MHQPVKGGELAFPLLGIAIPPILGSAVIYNEIDSFGNVDERTMHGSCPVLIGKTLSMICDFVRFEIYSYVLIFEITLTGEKWIATKLFH